jgi:hypothetical protein
MHLVLVVLAVGIAVAIPVIYIFLGFSAVRLLRDIRDILRQQQRSG